MKLHRYVDSPLCRIVLTSDGDSLTGLYFEGQKYEPQLGSDWAEDATLPLFAMASDQLAEYFAGERSRFELPLAPVGTPFQQRVWQRLQVIPYGARLSYGAIAQSLGQPRATRAVGAAVGRNPLSVIIPCHRVVGSDDSLTGYAGGIERKKALLELEASHA
jgi:methylated-DNA-[protein]-cysteine S-methyltransferase